MRKSFEAEEYFALKTGYVYLSINIDEALEYGLNKSIVDTTYLHIPENIKLNPNYRDPVVLGINGFKLGDNLEIDPEINTIQFQEIDNIKNGKFQWYRYKGDIKVKHLFICKHVPFDSFSSNLIDKLLKFNENRFHSDLYVMRRLTE
jgi:hypothetical protein